MQVRSRLMWLAGAFMALASMAACGSTGTGNTSGGNACVPGSSQACACTDGRMGAQTCNAEGSGYDTCSCNGSSSSSSSGTGGVSSSSSSGTMGTCGDGIIQPSDHCDNASSEFYCAQDCATGTGGAGTGGAGGACAGHVYYAGKYDGAPSVWAMLPSAGGMNGLDAGNAQCKGLNIGADHVCDYEEIKLASMNGEAVFTTIPMGTTAWVQRTTPALVNGSMSAPGPGGRCNNWTYATNHIGDGEYITFDATGVPTYHLDNDTAFDAAMPGVHTQADLPCGGAMRSILCCYQACQ